MALKNAHPERGTLIEATDFDDGRLTFVKRYASFDTEEGELTIDTWVDAYGDQQEGWFTITKQGTEELRKFLNKALGPRRRRKRTTVTTTEL